MSLWLTLGSFKWVEEICKINEDFMKSFNEDRSIGYFMEADVQYPEEFHERHNDLTFSPKRMSIENVEKLIANLHDENIMLYT